MRRCTMMAHLRLMTLSLMVMPACQRASRRPSNAARSCARRGPARNVLFCLQTLKNGTLTHPSLWEDYCFSPLPGSLREEDARHHLGKESYPKKSILPIRQYIGSLSFRLPLNSLIPDGILILYP